MSLQDAKLDEFIARHRLPDSYRQSIEQHYLSLAKWLERDQMRARPLIVGINGAQGTGKTTLAEFLSLALQALYDRRTAILSIDDFYLTRADRLHLARTVHPLFETRGAPGTHDVHLLEDCLLELKELGRGEHMKLPSFDKAIDDRADESMWPTVTGPLDVVILEGWCVGSAAQTSDELRVPVNELERDEDPHRDWRNYVNEHLAYDYEPLFDQLNALIFLKAPSFEAVYRWRREQEHKLRDAASEDESRIMDDDEIRRFIQFYERITRANISELPKTADVILELGEDHACKASIYRQ